MSEQKGELLSLRRRRRALRYGLRAVWTAVAPWSRTDVAREYDACRAHQGGTWGGMGEWPHCWLERGHTGPHEDPACIVRWNEPITFDFAAPSGEVPGA